jgi:autotransporter-associated beta strand protein
VSFLVSAQAQLSTWDGGAADDFWSSGSNWIGDSVPPNDGTATLVFAGTSRLTPFAGEAWSLSSLRFAAGAGAFAISGSSLTVGSGGVLNVSGTTQSLSNAIALSTAQLWTASTSNLSISGPVDNSGFLLTISAASGRAVTMNGAVSGTGGLRKNGSGGLTLTGSNSFSGGVTLTAGTLTASHDYALGSGTLTLGGGTLTSGSSRIFNNAVALTANTSLTGQAMTFASAFNLASNATLTVSNATTLAGGISETGGARALTKAGTGTLIVLNSFSSSGNVTVQAGTLALGAGVLLPSSLLTLNGGILATQGTLSRSLGTGASQVNFAGSGGFAAYGGGLVINGFTGTPIWGTTPGFLSGSSSLLLNSTVATDVVTWANDFSLGAATRTISVADNTSTTADKAVIAGIISGTGGLNKTGTGRLDLTAANTFEGGVWIQQGEVAVDRLANAGAASSLGAGSGTNAAILLGNTTSTATLRYTGSGHGTDRSLILAGSTGGAVLAADGSGTATFSGSVSASAAGAKMLTLTGTGAGELAGSVSNGSGTLALQKTGAGLWIISGSNAHSGNTTLSAGTLEVRNSGAFGSGTFVLAGGTLRAGSGPSLGNTVSLTANSEIGGTGALTLSGTVSQTGSRTLTINNTALTTLSGPALVLAENNQARILTISGSGNLWISSVIQDGAGSGADRLTKSGTGELTLTGANTYTGTTTMLDGLLSLGNDSALGTGSVVISSGAIRGIGGSRTLGNTLLLGGNFTVSGTSNLTFAGTSTLTGNRTLSVNNTGTTTFSDVDLSSSTTSRTLTVATTGDTVISGVIANGGGSTAGALRNTGTGRLILLGANTYSGTTTVAAGTLEIRNGSALGSTAAGTTVSSGATLALSGGISTSESLTITGTGVGGNGAIRNLSGSNTITSRIIQTGSSRIVSDAGVLTVNVASGTAVSGAFALTVAGAGDVYFASRVSTGAGFTKNGAGTVTFAGTGNNLGTTTVNGGRLVVLGNLAGSGGLTVGAAGTLAGTGGIGVAATINGQHALGSAPGTQTFSAGLAYNGGSSLQWELDSNTIAGPGTNFDQVLVTGGNLAVAAGSTASLVFDGAGSTVDWSDTFWTSGHSWTVVDFSGGGASSGVFGSIVLTADSLGQSLGTVRPGGSFSIANSGGDVILTYAIVPEPAVAALLWLAAGLLAGGRRSRQRVEA